MSVDPSQLGSEVNFEVASSLKEWTLASKVLNDFIIERAYREVVDSKCKLLTKVNVKWLTADHIEESFEDGALEHLASIDLIELCNEAKIEHCRATRDLRSCGRNVQSVLNSCGHASLCEECSQRCDACPICRYPIPKTGNRVRLRLFYECIEAGLISKRCDDRFQEKDGQKQLTADVDRLYSFFDVAMENNLISLICHYVTDVCMDESAVSSDPAVALLLDEVVVKDWCKRTFKNIIAVLKGLYNLTVKDMKERLTSLFKFSARLGGLSNVLEVLESSFKDSLSAQLQDMLLLHDRLLKTKQHLEIMIWCIKHEFLEKVKSQHRNFKSWSSVVHDRKTAAIKRSWPDPVNHPVKSFEHHGPKLFIEDALLNLEMEHGDTPEMGDGLEIADLHKDGRSSFLRPKLEGMDVCYPFDDLRSAIDSLFLSGSSDMVVAKQAIFLYYLFDRHWTMPEGEWRHYVDDFASTFNVTRHSILESLTFYLLDDHKEEALQEACRLLPEISGPTTHPKVAQVLLERQNPDAALIVLRWSGRDGGVELVTLGEAVTGVRVRVECGLLTEAFMYQRLLCTKIKEKKMKELHPHGSNELNDEIKKWVETLVTEICILCIRRNLVDKIIELPWNSDEEKYLHKCLLDMALEDPTVNIGSLLVVFYLQRYRYAEAYQVDRKLQTAEQEFITGNPVSESLISKMKSASHWRAGLVEKSVQLLPEVQQQKVKVGKLPEVVSAASDHFTTAISDLPKVQEPAFTSLLVPSSVPFWRDNGIASLKPSASVTPLNVGSVNIPHFKNYASPDIPRVNAFNNAGGLNPLTAITKNFKFDDIAPSSGHHVRPVTATPSKGINGSSLRLPQSSKLLNSQFDGVSPDKGQTGFGSQFQSSSPYISRGVAANPVAAHGSSNEMFYASPGSYLNVSGKYDLLDRPDRARNAVASGDFMDVSWSNGVGRSSKPNINGGPRWRSDDNSDDEELPSPRRLAGVALHKTPSKGVRRSSRLLAKR